ncbi:MAG: phosphatidylglycerol lysyltransferase domain-containing protein [Deltaproteobacteria bacterium]|jgi:hypothetical protein|nr:phosphatidylglycerol lysyltransferase domain-containing protein [Deltaproteobacteria bacterium]
MTPDFSPISPYHAKEYKALLCMNGSRASDYSFGNIWGWAEHYGLEWRLLDGLCWIRQSRPRACLWAPVGDWKSRDWAASRYLDEGGEFIRVPEEMLRLWQEAFPGRVLAEESRGQWDYLYKTQDLAQLPGNRFHKKKNLVNQFTKLYEFSYLSMTADCVESVLKMQQEWVRWREIEDSSVLMAENTVVSRLLSLWNDIPGLVGGAIHVGGKVVAYTVGERICRDTMAIHFEKGMPGYKGIYQAINKFFAGDVAEDMSITYINREQDLDDPGLRQAKESYNPSEYVKKSMVKILPAKKLRTARAGGKLPEKGIGC